MPNVALVGTDILVVGDVVSFSLTFTGAPFMQPSADDVAAAIEGTTALSGVSAQASVAGQVITLGTATLMEIQATSDDVQAANIISSDVYNAISSLTSGLTSCFVGTIYKQGTLSQAIGLSPATPNPNDKTNSGFQWSTSVGLIAVALIVVSGVYFLKGVRVG